MITKPTLLVDKKKCQANIERMASKAKRHNLEFRPHFKTHQSIEIGEWFRDAGLNKITVSSVDMAMFFAKAGWKDITIAFPVNILEIEKINDLAESITLNLLVESSESILFLQEELIAPVNLFIKLDLGTHRTGIDPTNIDLLQSLKAEIDEALNLEFAGFLSHAGHSYRCRGKEEILEVHEDCMAQLAKLKEKFPDVFISYGDSPTCSHAEDFGPVDEIRAGNFAFYDCMQELIGSCTHQQIAVAMACPVVAKHPERNEVVIYGGGVHFSKEQMKIDDQVVYGQVVESEENCWNEPIDGAKLVRISQEHGIIQAPTEWIKNVEIGDIVKVLPVHSCMTMDLMRHLNIEFI